MSEPTIPPHRAAATPPVHAVTTQDGALIDDGRELDPASVCPPVEPVAEDAASTAAPDSEE
jgi:hypothetical protein